MREWTVYTRDSGGIRSGQVEDYTKAQLITRFNAVGFWTVAVPAAHPVATALLQPGAGIEFRATGMPDIDLTGPVAGRKRIRASGVDTLAVWGPDDTIVLDDRLASPEPATAAPPYSTSAYDVRTGVASTIMRQYVDVNTGPSALAQRRVAGLTIAADPVLGASTTGRARWQKLLELVQSIAEYAGLGFRVRGLVFEVYAPRDLTASIKFSQALANLGAFEYDATAPEANYYYCGGSGEGTGRLIVEGQDAESIAGWRRIEAFRDRRDTAIAAELEQTIIEELAKSTGATSLDASLVDTPTRQYGQHYRVGDRITIVVDGAPVQEIVRQATVDLTGSGETVKILAGGASHNDVLRLFNRLRQLTRQVSNLERR